LRISLFLVLILGALAAAVMAALPHVTVAVLFGHRYSAAPPLIRILAPEGAAMGVVGLFTYYHVAQRSVYAVVPWAGVALVSIWMMTDQLSAHGLAVLMTVCALVVSVVMAVPALQGSRRRATGAANATPRAVAPEA
jgi:O-antigen/teichoic acid export membrane protein